MTIDITKEQTLKILNDSVIINITNDYYPNFSAIVTIYILDNNDRLIITSLDNNVIKYTYKFE